MVQFRLDSSYLGNLKLKKLRRRLGADGVLAHLALLAYAADHRPNGKLTGMPREDVEAAVDWDGEDGALISALIEFGLVDVSEPTQSRSQLLTIHDWAEHNQWVTGSQGRINGAQFQNHERWHVKRGLTSSDCQFCPTIQLSPVVESVTDSATDGTESVKDSTPRPDSTRPDSDRIDPVPNIANEKPAVADGLPLLSGSQANVARVLAIFEGIEPKPKAALVGSWLKACGGDVDVLVSILTPYIGQTDSYLSKVVSNPLNRKNAGRQVAPPAARTTRFRTEELPS